MLEELIDLYREDATVHARPYVHGRETVRWFLEINGHHVPDVELRITEQAGRPGTATMLLVVGDEEVEFGSWSTTLYPFGPAAVTRRLGDLR